MFTFLAQKKWIIIVAILLIVVGFYVSVSQQIAKEELIEERARLEQELEHWKARKVQLLEQIEKTGDLGFIESIAREKLKMVKPDEMIYIVY